MSINDSPLNKVGKNEFSREKEDGGRDVFVLTGSYLTGVKMNTQGRTVQIVKPPKWYEIALAVLILVFNLVWGNVVALCEIIPLVGGAIGGLVCGVFAVLGLVISRNVKKPLFKILILLAAWGLSVLICFGIGSAILAAVK